MRREKQQEASAQQAQAAAYSQAAGRLQPCLRRVHGGPRLIPLMMPARIQGERRGGKRWLLFKRCVCYSGRYGDLPVRSGDAGSPWPSIRRPRSICAFTKAFDCDTPRAAKRPARKISASRFSSSLTLPDNKVYCNRGRQAGETRMRRPSALSARRMESCSARCRAKGLEPGYRERNRSNGAIGFVGQ